MSSQRKSDSGRSATVLVESIEDATASYEKWLAKFMPIVTGDLAQKHDHMAESPFMFLRATFYRWMQLWNATCPELNAHTKVLGIGDLHIENFGTWRDLDGRLIWGVNDFDETFTMPHSLDIVRLAVSAAIAHTTGAIGLDPGDALEAIIAGYERGLQKHGVPFVLEEHHTWLRKMALNELREPVTYWERLSKLPTARPSATLRKAKKVLLSCLPVEDGAKASDVRFAPRVAGLGSLGRPRFIALTLIGGSWVCREAKAVAPSACLWALSRETGRVLIPDLLKTAKRVADPHYALHGDWIVRRLAPHCSKIDLSHIPRRRDDLALMESMGVEIANLHLGSRTAGDLPRKLSAAWRRSLREGMRRMTDLTLDDWNAWRIHHKTK